MAAMAYQLMVPIHLDALVLETDAPVSEAFADFSRLPYYDAALGRDVNPDTAYIGASLGSPPLQDAGLMLSAGIHLHWSQPDALTRGRQGAPRPVKDDRDKPVPPLPGGAGVDPIINPDPPSESEGGPVTLFPVLPNRWLVVRSVESSAVDDRQWVIESDYLGATDNGLDEGRVSYPIKPEPGQPPFAYLGRVTALSDWLTEDHADPERRYLSRLTAMGYGDPSFAAFYPNCRGVFGFYDQPPQDVEIERLRYDVIGWHSDPESDPLTEFFQHIRENYPDQTVEQAIAEKFGWAIVVEKDGVRKTLGPEDETGAVETLADLPKRMLCYARIGFEPSAVGTAPRSTVRADIAVGATGTEALSAYVANKIGGVKKTIEDQLEAILLAPGLRGRRLDVGPKFEEARHQKGFSPMAGETRWAIRPMSHPTAQADASQGSPRPQATLDDEELATALHHLNRAQHDRDLALREMDALRRRVYSDWHKYMLSAYPPIDLLDDYPDIDEVRFFIETVGLQEADAKVAAIIPLETALTDAKNVLVGLVNSHNAKSNRKDAEKFELSQGLSARFWRPTEPVVLIAGPLVKPTTRHGQDGRMRDDGLLECQLSEIDSFEHWPGTDQIAGLLERIDDIERTAAEGQIGVSTMAEPPWHPFMLEWMVEYFPVHRGGNQEPHDFAYDPGYVNDSYGLKENASDLVLREGRDFGRGANVYSGRCLLSPHANVQLKDRIVEHLGARIRADFDARLEALENADASPATGGPLPGTGDVLPPPGGDPPEWDGASLTPEKLDSLISEGPGFDALLVWYQEQTWRSSQPADDNLIQAYRELIDLASSSLSQALGGFNQALIMLEQANRLPVADPLGFEDNLQFADDVAEAVGRQDRLAPQALSDFNPIRAGALRILQLRLIDTFGQSRDLIDPVNPPALVTSAPLTVDNAANLEQWRPELVSLPPRLVQPARLNFRWLSAGLDEIETNEHPATTPVCGWLLPNNLDGGVMVYDKDGRALGAIGSDCAWRSPPGTDGPTIDRGEALPSAVIANSHLRRVADALRAKDETFLGHMLSVIDSALRNIEPESYAQHGALAILMGRPIAVVRASIDLELREPPAIHHGWNVFRQSMARGARDSDAFTRVAFPVRLGEHRQLNDGLVGYWIEAEDPGPLAGRFYSPQGEEPEAQRGPDIVTHDEAGLILLQSVDAPPKTVTMLVDPRGAVHATTGILPTKAIDLPPDQFAHALKAIEITFLSTPILTDPGGLRLPLPEEPGYAWSWIENRRGVWSETPRDQIGAVSSQAKFGDRSEIREGWLKLKLKPGPEPQPDPEPGDVEAI